jgi:hypothetical protein
VIPYVRNVPTANIAAYSIASCVEPPGSRSFRLCVNREAGPDDQHFGATFAQICKAASISLWLLALRILVTLVARCAAIIRLFYTGGQQFFQSLPTGDSCIATIGSLFDCVVGACEQSREDGEGANFRLSD